MLHFNPVSHSRIHVFREREETVSENIYLYHSVPGPVCRVPSQARIYKGVQYVKISQQYYIVALVLYRPKEQISDYKHVISIREYRTKIKYQTFHEFV